MAPFETMSNLAMRAIQEGKARLNVPKTVFYNPVQEFNRDLSVLALKTFLKYNLWHHRSEEKHVKLRGGLKILDALSASGLRSIRYAKELGEHSSIVRKIVANDISTEAVELIKKNIESNEVSHIVECSHSDASTLLHLSSRSFDDRFHVIDLDPFGSGAQFFDSAVKSIGEAGLLMVTCTDTAVLCGNASESCFARYGSMSIRSESCHEHALRIILRSIESHAAVYGRYIKPLLSLSVDFYVRLFIQVFSQQSESKKSASKLSQVYSCKECKTQELNPLGTCILKDDPEKVKSPNDAVKYLYKPSEVRVSERCRICGGKNIIGGPIWSEPIHDEVFLELLKKELSIPDCQDDFATFRRIEGLVYMASEELTTPLLYSIDTMASTLKMKMPKKEELFSALINSNYRISLTHTNKSAFKTDAPSHIVWDLFCQFAANQKVETDDGLALRILERPRDKVYDPTYNPSILAESKKRSMLRFQVNPAREWGPKARPSHSLKSASSSPPPSPPSKSRKLDESQKDESYDGTGCIGGCGGGSSGDV